DHYNNNSLMSREKYPQVPAVPATAQVRGTAGTWRSTRSQYPQVPAPSTRRLPGSVRVPAVPAGVPEVPAPRKSAGQVGYRLMCGYFAGAPRGYFAGTSRVPAHPLRTRPDLRLCEWRGYLLVLAGAFPADS